MDKICFSWTQLNPFYSVAYVIGVAPYDFPNNKKKKKRKKRKGKGEKKERGEKNCPLIIDPCGSKSYIVSYTAKMNTWIMDFLLGFYFVKYLAK